jgi:hypothetical protein
LIDADFASTQTIVGERVEALACLTEEGGQLMYAHAISADTSLISTEI